MKQVKILFFIIGLSVSSLSYGLGEEGGAYKVTNPENEATSSETSIETPIPLSKSLPWVLGAWLSSSDSMCLPTTKISEEEEWDPMWLPTVNTKIMLADSLVPERFWLKCRVISGSKVSTFRAGADPKVVPTVGMLREFIYNANLEYSGGALFCRVFLENSEGKYERELTRDSQILEDARVKSGAVISYYFMNYRMLAALYALAPKSSRVRRFGSLEVLRKTNISRWPGVKVNKAGDIVDLRLDFSKCFRGPIPSELGQLVTLEFLYLSWMEITGPIPTELGNLVNLKKLCLRPNQLTGPIPTELGQLENLEKLFLSDNQLTGVIPTEIGQLVRLEDIHFQCNHLTGAIPTELGNLVNLISFYSYPKPEHNTKLEGLIPTELGMLVELRYLNLAHNKLTGAIPTELGKLLKLRCLDLQNNQLTGPIPTEIGNLVNLFDLDLRNNQLIGADEFELLREHKHYIRKLKLQPQRNP